MNLLYRAVYFILFLLINTVGYTEISSKCIKLANLGLKDISSFTKEGFVTQNPFANKCPLTLKFLSYASYLSSQNSASNPLEIIGFLKRNPSWPNKESLKHHIEKLTPRAIKKEVPHQLITWFHKVPPKKGATILIYLKEVEKSKGKEFLKRVVKKSWVEGSFCKKDETIFLKLYSHLLSEKDHWDRTNKALWEKNHDLVKRMLPKLSKKHQLLANTRIYLQRQKLNLSNYIEKCEKHFKKHRGFLYDILVWHRKNRENDKAHCLLSKIGASQKNKRLFWRERHILARRALEERDYKKAYSLASNHSLSFCVDFLNAEFLSGWIALRYLNKPQIAEIKFKNLYEKVSTPISKSRTAYWLGRAYEAQGKKLKAKETYKKAAKFKTTFYGQQAARSLGLTNDIYFFKKYTVNPLAKKSVNSREFSTLLELLSKVPSSYPLQKPFVLNFANQAKNIDEKIYTLELIHKYMPYFAADAARTMNIKGEIYTKTAFPTLYKKYIPSNLENPLVWSIVRRESGFDHRAISSAGAMGLMQLMPRVAKEVAKKYKIPFSHKDKLIEDPQLNIKIGTKHLLELIKYYKGIYPFVLAAYNAGAHNVDKWIKTFGNPVKGEIDWIDWLESIPFYETRDYVQRVLEHLHIYTINYSNKKTFKPFIVKE